MYGVWILRVSRFPAGKTPSSYAVDNRERHTGRSMAFAYQLLTGYGNTSTSGPGAGAVPPTMHIINDLFRPTPRNNFEALKIIRIFPT